ncbi:hypothetical protein GmHk_15G044525 [Glycine max]|nr:hypothetical protein GmHk_15G044525 [Glycine max]
MHVVLLDAFQDLTQIGSYAWGVTTLVHMYDNLNDASKSSGKQLARYITLLQCQTRYSLEACQAIAERFERFLNLRIVTEDTDTYHVREDCLRIARGVTADRNVYVRS